MELNINFDDLIEWSKFIGEGGQEKKAGTKAAIARALNSYGQGVMQNTIDYVSQRTDLPPEAVYSMIMVKEATPNNLEWSMDASAVAQPDAWNKPWTSRDQTAFAQDELVKIVNFPDDKVCQVCLDAAANSPYTLEEVAMMQARWANWTPPTPVEGERTNLVHPNCRCYSQAWSSPRRMPLSFGKPGAAPPELFTTRQLGKLVADALEVSLKVVK